VTAVTDRHNPSGGETSAIAVCATPGHHTGVVTAGIEPRPGDTSEANASCPRGWFASALGLAIAGGDDHSRPVRAVQIGSDGKSGRVVVGGNTRGMLSVVCTR
jgi:hypothetical protein